MSASRSLRCAFDSARPAKRISTRARSLIQSRTYADASAAQSCSSNAEVKPTRKETAPRNKQIEQLKDAPPKRFPLPAEKPASAKSTGVAIQSGLDASKSATGKALGEPSKPLPPNVIAAFRTPYKHEAKHGIPVASLQLRSYSVRNLEFFADFALRVAYYLKLPATGPAPLPKQTERWTMPRSNFVHKKSQENFERITLRRLITVYDGHPDVVEIWLACLRKWQFYGVGMKANVWHFESLDVASKMDTQLQEVEKDLDAKLANFGWNNSVAGKKSIQEMLLRQGARVAGSPMTEVRDEIKSAKNMDLFRDVQ